MAAGAGEAQGVGEQVEQHLLDAAFVGVDVADAIVAQDLDAHFRVLGGGDDEIDRVGDLDMITPRFAPLQAGEPVRVAASAVRNEHGVDVSLSGWPCGVCDLKLCSATVSTCCVSSLATRNGQKNSFHMLMPVSVAMVASGVSDSGSTTRRKM